MWPFSRKQKSDLPKKLVFESGEAFLDHQCEYGHTQIVPNQGIVALVLDSRKEFGTTEPVKVETDGRQIVALKVASEDGGFVVMSETPTGGGDRLKPDDVVIWAPLEYMDTGAHAIDLADIDPRFGWAGIVVAKIKPQLDMDNPEFVIVSRYD